MEEADERHGAGDAQSGIEFFERHPLDSRSPLTFLDGGCGSGDGGGREVCEEEEKKNGGQGADDKAKNDGRGEVKQVSQSASWYDLPATPPRDIPHAKAKAMAPGHDALAGFERLDLQVHGRTRRMYSEPRRTMSQLERKMRARPMALYEMPGRYRSPESCWHCADEGVGKHCQFCGLVVRRNSEEKY